MKKRTRKITKVLLILISFLVIYYLFNSAVFKHIHTLYQIVQQDEEYLNRFIEHRQYLSEIKPVFWSFGIKNNSCYAKTEENYNWVCILPIDSYGHMTFGQSMYPTIMIGNTLLLQKYPKYLKLKEGVIVRFNYGNATYVHRIKKIKLDGKIITQGDNVYETEEIYPENVTDIVVGVLYTSPDFIQEKFEDYNKT